MSDFWKDIKKTATEAGKIVTTKTKEYSKIATIKIQLANIKLEKNDLNMKLGDAFYKYNKKHKLEIEDKKIQELLKNITQAIKKETKYKKDLKILKESAKKE